MAEERVSIVNWPAHWTVRLGDNYAVDLSLVWPKPCDQTFAIYSFDMMGKSEWNMIAAASLYSKIREMGVQFDVIMTAEAKAIGLVQELARFFKQDYVVLRKGKKAYMQSPLLDVQVQSITTATPQHFYLGAEKFPELKGRRVLYVDDVVSLGGTVKAVHRASQEIGFDLTAIACVLTEWQRRTEWGGIPLLSLDHIPLPAGDYTQCDQP
jgi:adenine phosphoribosyltransferase